MSVVEKSAAKSRPVQESKADYCLYSLQKCEYERLVIKFRKAHAVAKSNLRFRMYNLLTKT